jgi:hypothetical protein
MPCCMATISNDVGTGLYYMGFFAKRFVCRFYTTIPPFQSYARPWTIPKTIPKIIISFSSSTLS